MTVATAVHPTLATPGPTGSVQAPPLTRRRAREIERATGRRPIARVVPVESAALTRRAVADRAVADRAVADRAVADRAVADLAERSVRTIANAVVADAAVADAAVSTSASSTSGQSAVSSAFARPATIRAARPAALVRRTRRRVGAGLGLAASAAVMATAAVVAPSAMADANLQQAANGALVTPDSVSDETQPLPEGAAVEAGAADASSAQPGADLVAAPETAPDRADFSVVSFEPGVVEETVIETAATGTGSGSSATGSASGGSGIDLAAIAATAASMVGTGGYTHCDAFVREVYGMHGITLGVGVSAQAAQGTPTSNPQPGDLVVWPGQHIGIYAGNGMVYDSPGISDPRPIQHRNISWGNPYYVTLA